MNSLAKPLSVAMVLSLFLISCSNEKRSSSAVAPTTGDTSSSSGGVFSSSGSSSSGSTTSSSSSSGTTSSSGSTVPSDCQASVGSLGSSGTNVVEVDPYTHAGTYESGLVVEAVDSIAPPFRRTGVQRANNFCLNYSGGQFCRNFWYTSQFDSGGQQFVSYTPNIATLGVGYYDIEIYVLSFDSLASYGTNYIVANSFNPSNNARFHISELITQKKSPLNMYHPVIFSNVYLCKNSFLQMKDSGSGQVLFPKVVFRKRSNSES